mgnify:CR=1 FL=1
MLRNISLKLALIIGSWKHILSSIDNLLLLASFILSSIVITVESCCLAWELATFILKLFKNLLSNTVTVVKALLNNCLNCLAGKEGLAFNVCTVVVITSKLILTCPVLLDRAVRYTDSDIRHVCSRDEILEILTL